MATINVQAGVAAHVLPTQPEAAADALQAIKTASKEGLRELRAILNVLRQADDADPVQPAPGTAQLDALIEGARRSGLETTLTVTGEPYPLPAAVDLAAYRIVQESLTNVIRHAGPASAAVSLAYHDDELRVDVTDTGHGPHGQLDGHRPDTAWPGCASAPPPSAGRADRPAPRRRLPGRGPPPHRQPKRRPRDAPGCRACGRDPGPARRRPGPDPGRVPRPGRRRRGPSGGRRGGRRPAGGGPGPPRARRRGADGHPDARGGRPGGHQAHLGRRGPGRGQGHHLDHVRVRRVRLPGPARRGQRLPGQGHRTRRPPPGRPRGGPRRRAAVAQRDPPAHHRHRHPPRTPAAQRRGPGKP